MSSRTEKNTSVIILAYNRPHLLKLTLAQLPKSTPMRLFVSVDGPKSDSPQDEARVSEVRSVIDSFDWPTQVHKLYHESNLGCQQAVSQAISWFFQHVDRGIILEDDCVADPSFFRFCSELLDRYADDPRVGVITGNNFQRGQRWSDASYYFSKHNHCWGWATWKRAWETFDYSVGGNEACSDASVVNRFTCAQGEVRYWSRIFRGVRRGEINSWAYRWTYSCWANRLLTVTPAVNLVENIGFGDDATHTKRTSGLEIPKRQTMPFPMTHPTRIEQCVEADAFTTQKHFQIDPSVIARTHRLIASAKAYLDRR